MFSSMPDGFSEYVDSESEDESSSARGPRCHFWQLRFVLSGSALCGVDNWGCVTFVGLGSGDFFLRNPTQQFLSRDYFDAEDVTPRQSSLIADLSVTSTNRQHVPVLCNGEMIAYRYQPPPPSRLPFPLSFEMKQRFYGESDMSTTTDILAQYSDVMESAQDFLTLPVLDMWPLPDSVNKTRKLDLKTALSEKNFCHTRRQWRKSSGSRSSEWYGCRRWSHEESVNEKFAKTDAAIEYLNTLELRESVGEQTVVPSGVYATAVSAMDGQQGFPRPAIEAAMLTQSMQELSPASSSPNVGLTTLIRVSDNAIVSDDDWGDAPYSQDGSSSSSSDASSSCSSDESDYVDAHPRTRSRQPLELEASGSDERLRRLHRREMKRSPTRNDARRQAAASSSSAANEPIEVITPVSLAEDICSDYMDIGKISICEFCKSDITEETNPIIGPFKVVPQGLSSSRKQSIIEMMNEENVEFNKNQDALDGISVKNNFYLQDGHVFKRLWVHLRCAMATSGITIDVENKKLLGLNSTWKKRSTKCSLCAMPGATVGCYNSGCKAVFHYQCSLKTRSRHVDACTVAKQSVFYCTKKCCQQLIPKPLNDYISHRGMFFKKDIRFWLLRDIQNPCQYIPQTGDIVIFYPQHMHAINQLQYRTDYINIWRPSLSSPVECQVISTDAQFANYLDISNQSSSSVNTQWIPEYKAAIVIYVQLKIIPPHQDAGLCFYLHFSPASQGYLNSRDRVIESFIGVKRIKEGSKCKFIEGYSPEGGILWRSGTLISQIDSSSKTDSVTDNLQEEETIFLIKNEHDEIINLNFESYESARTKIDELQKKVLSESEHILHNRGGSLLMGCKSVSIRCDGRDDTFQCNTWDILLNQVGDENDPVSDSLAKNAPWLDIHLDSKVKLKKNVLTARENNILAAFSVTLSPDVNSDMIDFFMRFFKLIINDTSSESIYTPFVDLIDFPPYWSSIPLPNSLKLISLRLKNRYYNRIISLVSDINLLVANCIKFNHPDSFYSTCAKRLHLNFWKALDTLGGGITTKTKISDILEELDCSLDISEAQNHKLIVSPPVKDESKCIYEVDLCEGVRRSSRRRGRSGSYFENFTESESAGSQPPNSGVGTRRSSCLEEESRKPNSRGRAKTISDEEEMIEPTKKRRKRNASILTEEDENLSEEFCSEYVLESAKRSYIVPNNRGQMSPEQDDKTIGDYDLARRMQEEENAVLEEATNDQYEEHTDDNEDYSTRAGMQRNRERRNYDTRGRVKQAVLSCSSAAANHAQTREHIRCRRSSRLADNS
eukprot:GHVL01043378.1.p1 GENE.GHVL01043378.1~~GHVL01043378.1.p1  ORF type:complete len:1443 (+),score=249.01 GHVL01043378.1:467-4330(+)